MNFGEIRADVRSLIIEPQPGFRSNTELNRWINQAHQELGMLYGIEATATIEIGAGANFYKLPDDLLTLRGAWDENHTAVSVLPALIGNNDPVFERHDELLITVFGNTFIVSPPPETVKFITLFYTRRPKILTSDSDEPEIPEPYHRYLVAYATMRALQKDEAYEEAAVYAQEYEMGKQLISQHRLGNLRDMDTVLELLRYNILNPAEAAQWLNLPMKQKIWQRVEVEDKALRLLGAGAISKEDLIKNTVFPDREEIQERLSHTASDLVPLPPFWGDDIDG